MLIASHMSFTSAKLLRSQGAELKLRRVVQVDELLRAHFPEVSTRPRPDAAPLRCPERRGGFWTAPPRRNPQPSRPVDRSLFDAVGEVQESQLELRTRAFRRGVSLLMAEKGWASELRHCGRDVRELRSTPRR